MGFILSLITNFILIFYIILIIINNKKEKERGNRLNRQLTESQLTEKYLSKLMTLECQIYQQKMKSEQNNKQNKKIIYKGNCTHCGAPKRIDLDYCEYCDCAYEEELQSYDDIPF